MRKCKCGPGNIREICLSFMIRRFVLLFRTCSFCFCLGRMFGISMIVRNVGDLMGMRVCEYD